MRAHRSLTAAVAIALGLAAGSALGAPPSPPGGKPAVGTGAVEGTVLDDAGKPVEGARVTLTAPGWKAPLSATTDAAGKWSLRGVPAGDVEVVVRSRSRVTSAKTARVEDKGTAKSDATLPPGVRFEGKVRDLRDQPVPGATVAPEIVGDSGGGGFAFPPEPSTTGADGSFVADGLEPGHTYKLRIRHARFLPVELPGYPAEAGTVRNDIDVTLEDAAWISGTIVDAAGKPVPSARIGTQEEMDQGGDGGIPPEIRDFFRRMGVRVFGGGDDSLAGKPVDSQGRFQIGSLPPEGEVQIVAAAEGYFRSTVNFDHLAAGKETAGVQITLEAATAWVEGVVVDPEGKPVAGATVTASGDSGSAGTAKTDAQGKFRIAKVRSRGPVSLSASAEGYVDGDKDEVALNSSGTKVEIAKMARIRVKVVDAAGKPIAKVTLATKVTVDEKNVYHDRTSFEEQPAEGLLVLVRPGKAELSASAEGYHEQTVGTWDLASGQTMDAGTFKMDPKAPAPPPAMDDGGDSGGDGG